MILNLNLNLNLNQKKINNFNIIELKFHSKRHTTKS
jgi:hypothetical protein